LRFSGLRRPEGALHCGFEAGATRRAVFIAGFQTGAAPEAAFVAGFQAGAASGRIRLRSSRPLKSTGPGISSSGPGISTPIIFIRRLSAW
jgi:hypothetical protein